MTPHRNSKLLITLLLLTAATVALVFFGGSDKIDLDESMFSVADQNNIDRVVFESSTEKIELTFNGSKWMVNGRYEADAQLVTVFFASILQAAPKRKLSGVLLDSIGKKMEEKGIAVSLWQGAELAKQFSVVGNDQKTETYFQLQNGDPYFITIPGYRVYVASIFELSENDWRDKHIFNFNWQNFKSLKARFPQQSKQDFTVSLINSLFSIEEVAVADTTKLSGYLESIFNLKADRFLGIREAHLYDSLLASPPLFQLEIEDIAKHVYSLNVYYSKEKDQPIVAKTHEEQLLLLQPAVAARILRARDYFIMR
jgi:hypothetical protein